MHDCTHYRLAGSFDPPCVQTAISHEAKDRKLQRPPWISAAGIGKQASSLNGFRAVSWLAIDARSDPGECLSPKTKPRSTDKAKDAAPSYTLDEAPGFLLRVALRTHTAFFTAKMIEGLTAPQFSTLAKLREVGPCSQNHLGRLIHYDSATITGVITRLKSRGLITSYKDPLDPRRREIDLTEKGRRIADAAIETIGEISSETFSPLSQQEFRTLTEILKKVIRR